MEVIIKQYIEENIPELNGKLYPVFTTDISTLTVVYAFSPLSGGHVKQSQLELKVIGEDYDQCKEMEQKIMKLLDTEEDEAFVNYKGLRFHSEVSGGGILFNDGCNRWEDTVYFVIDWRKKNVI